MSLDVSLAREPAGVADSGAEAQETLGGGHERLRWPIENGYDGREQLGVRFKRAPVAPILPAKPHGEAGWKATVGRIHGPCLPAQEPCGTPSRPALA